MLAPDFAAAAQTPSAGLRFFATHLHAHSFGRQLWVEHLRNGVVVGEFGHIAEFKGYGASQVWFLSFLGNFLSLF
jgi:hypothetical protein